MPLPFTTSEVNSVSLATNARRKHPQPPSPMRSAHIQHAPPAASGRHRQTPRLPPAVTRPDEHPAVQSPGRLERVARRDVREAVCSAAPKALPGPACRLGSPRTLLQEQNAFHETCATSQLRRRSPSLPDQHALLKRNSIHSIAFLSTRGSRSKHSQLRQHNCPPAGLTRLRSVVFFAEPDKCGH